MVLIAASIFIIDDEGNDKAILYKPYEFSNDDFEIEVDQDYIDYTLHNIIK